MRRPPVTLAGAFRRSLVLLPLCIVALVACTPERTPNLLLVSIDTLRPDHLGCYGYERPTSPAIDEYCEESLVFTQAIAQAPSTLPSHASILTSLIPHHHGASWETRTALAEEVTTLAEVLAQSGMRTAAFVGGGQMDPIFRLGQGFERYETPAATDFGRTVSAGLDWLKGIDEPFFLFLHTYETHHPYAPPQWALEHFPTDYAGPLGPDITVEQIRAINAGDIEISEADADFIRRSYDAEIRSVDRAFSRLVEQLKARGLWDDTLVIFTSDHGEEFGEHGEMGWHSHTLYDELLRVPLIIKLPHGRQGGERYDRQVRSIDIAPTALSILGFESPPEFSGVGLIDNRERGQRMAISRLDRPEGYQVSSVRTERHKLIRPHSRRQKLFDLINDPGETWDASVNHIEVVPRLLEAFDRTVAERPSLEAPEVNPDESTLEELRELGYIQ